LAILGLLADRNPGFTLKELRTVIQMYYAHVLSLRDRVAELEAKNPKGRKYFQITDELFVHIADQIEVLGYLPGYRAKIFETYHKQVLEMLRRASSGRHSDGYGSKGVLMAFEYARILADICARIDEGRKSEASPCTPPRSALEDCAPILRHQPKDPETIDLRK
jgi:hypothetical protein